MTSPASLPKGIQGEELLLEGSLSILTSAYKKQVWQRGVCVWEIQAGLLDPPLSLIVWGVREVSKNLFTTFSLSVSYLLSVEFSESFAPNGI